MAGSSHINNQENTLQACLHHFKILVSCSSVLHVRWYITMRLLIVLQMDQNLIPYLFYICVQDQHTVLSLYINDILSDLSRICLLHSTSCSAGNNLFFFTQRTSSYAPLNIQKYHSLLNTFSNIPKEGQTHLFLNCWLPVSPVWISWHTVQPYPSYL